MNKNLKRLLPDLLAVVTFALLSFAYFFPADLDGRMLFQHDTAAGAGAGQEVKQYRQDTGEVSRWTNSLFGGMPMYQISPSYESGEMLRSVESIYRLFLPDYVNLTFILMLGFYILLRAFNLPAWYAAIGGLMWAFSSYFFILISAGHIWKFVVLAYVPPTLAGIVLTFRGKLLAGGVLTALFVALQVTNNHVQMSYYFCFVILFFIAAYFEQALKRKELPQFFRAGAVVLAAALIGVTANLSNLYHTYTYSKHTMRGASELVSENAGAAQRSSTGLDRDYITQWSYGIGETLTLLVPDYKGGSSSVPLTASADAMAKADPVFQQMGIYNLGQYFGDQPGTSGPVYVGAFVLLLFMIGCVIVKGPLKWALIGATLFSIVLSWGKNFMPVTDFFIDYVPLYNKFRAVSSILVIAEFTIPLLAVFALKRLIDEPAVLREKLRPIGACVLLTAGVAMLLWLAPSALGNSYVPEGERRMLTSQFMQMASAQGVSEAEVSSILTGIFASLSEMRAALVSADALRSLMVLLVGMALIVAYAAGKLRSSFTLAGIAVLCVVDMWGVNKRYLNDAQFVPRTVRTDNFRLTSADRQVLADSTANYRVMSLSGDAFNENNTSYWHKSIGGYHPAKLRRYQDLIDRHISTEMQLAAAAIAEGGGRLDSIDHNRFEVLNMLNTRYFFMPTGQGEKMAVRNPQANGNAWLASEVRYVDNANQEIDALDEIDTRHTAVVDRRFASALHNQTSLPVDSSAYIRQTHYAPNRLTYTFSSTNDAVVVFSEIYYPDGWEVSIDGAPARLARANYVLRSLYVPAGQHTIEMRFDPQSLHTTEALAYAAIALIVMGLLYLVIRMGRVNHLKQKSNSSAD